MSAHLASVTVAYGDVVALDGVDLEVLAGESVAVLGPSGSGKTTLLYAVAGFVPLAAGEIRLAGSLVATPAVSTPPELRAVAMVFQNYALWPHLSALDTVAYPLRRRGLAKAGARREAARLLDRLGIGHLAERRPAELSGGQQQRVGLARALARDAELYLFDEPTAHLDAPLRRAVQEEIAARRGDAGAAGLYATHDAAEALALADRVLLLRDGKAIQIGSPAGVYARPVDGWAAELTGPGSVIDAEVVGGPGGSVRVVIGDRQVDVQSDAPFSVGRRPLLVRPDWAELGGPLPAAVTSVAYRGPHIDVRLATPCGAVDVRCDPHDAPQAGERVGWSLRRVWALPGADDHGTRAGRGFRVASAG